MPTTPCARGRTQRSRSGRIRASKPTTLRPTCTPPAHASVGSNETSEARGDGWEWTFQPPSRANTCILASAHGTPSSTRTSKRGEASRRSSAGRLMKACWSAAATVPSHASALSRPPTTGMRSYSARAAPGRMHGGRDHEASHRAHHQPHELAVAAASDRISPKMPLLDLLTGREDRSISGWARCRGALMHRALAMHRTHGMVI